MVPVPGFLVLGFVAGAAGLLLLIPALAGFDPHQQDLRLSCLKLSLILPERSEH